MDVTGSIEDPHRDAANGPSNELGGCETVVRVLGRSVKVVITVGNRCVVIAAIESICGSPDRYQKSDIVGVPAKESVILPFQEKTSSGVQIGLRDTLPIRVEIIVLRGDG